MPSKEKKPMTHTLLAGGTAGFVESSICHPLDTIKTRMQLRNNHIESVGTRLKHSLVEPAVMHVRHSLMEPALRFKHSLSEATILRGSSSQRPTHSLVEPANLVKLQRHALHEPSSVPSHSADVGGINRSANVVTNTSNLKSNSSWWSQKAIASGKSGDGNRGIVTKVKSSPSTLASTGGSNGENFWWNQPRQHHVKGALAETSNRSFQTKSNGISLPSAKQEMSSNVNSSVNQTKSWWNWHKGSSTALVSRGQSSKSGVWGQSTSSTAKGKARRWYGTHVSNWSTSQKGPLGPIQTARKIIRKEGFSSLYKGLSAVYVGIIPKMAIRFVAFEQYKDLIKMYTNLGDKSTNFMAGLSSGLTEAVLIVTPAEVCKIRIQSQRHSLLDPVEANARKYGNVVQTAMIIVREEGYSALYKGVVPTMLRQGCNQAVNFTVYNAMKAHWLERQKQQNFHNPAFGNSVKRSSESIQELPSVVSMLIGGLSGAMGPIVNNPLDVVKTRLQKQNTAKKFNGIPKYTGLIQACLRIGKEEGAGALWKGITPRLLRIVPGQAITFATYEAVCRFL